MKPRNERFPTPLLATRSSSAFAFALLLTLAPSSRAATFAVNSIGDFSDSNPGDGFCDVGGLTCTLRAAIEEANANPGADFVDLSNRASEIIVVATSLPPITEALTIDGANGAPTSISGGGAVRPFFVAANVTFSDVVIREGLAAGGNGGGSLDLGGTGGGAAGMGGGVFIQSGIVRFVRTSFDDNEARGGDGGILGVGSDSGGGGGGGVGGNGTDGTVVGGSGGPGGPLGVEGQGGAGGATDAGTAGGAFGGGGGGGGTNFFGGAGGAGGFGGGGGAGAGGFGNGAAGAGGTFAGAGASPGIGGGGAGLGGAIFIRAGSVSFNTCSFTNNTATRGTGGSNGQGKGGAIFLHAPGGATAANLGGLVLSGNAADDAGVAPDDNADIFGAAALPVTVSEIELD